MTRRAYSLSGSLDELTLSELIGFLASSGLTGVIELSGRNPGTIAMHDGRLTVAAAHGGQSLQEVVVGSGAVSDRVWRDSSLRASSDSPLIDLLIEAGAGPDLLAEVMREHAIGSLAELILSREGEFEFTADADDEIGSTISFETGALLEDVHGRVEAWREIAKLIPSTSCVMRLVRHLPVEHTTVDAEHWTLLALADGHTTVAEMVTELGVSAFTVLERLHELVEAGLVESA